ncbi:hypothetical protein J3Q64DRAFT_1641744, partial [Phycomyces blakesleeanus]
DNIPHVRPIPTNDKSSRRRNHPYNIPLAPPPTQENIRRAQDSARFRTETFLGNLPDEFLAQPLRQRTLKYSSSTCPQEDQPSPSSWSNRSIGKSSGSYSFYSTFGADSSTHSLDSIENSQPLDTALQHFISDPIDPDHLSNSNLHLTFNTTSSREERPAAKTPKLSNRLSGGHFGSAGGLILSTAPVPPPEDIAQAMLEWKRLSDGGVPKRMSTTIASGSTAVTNPGLSLFELAIRVDDPKAKEESEEELSGIDKQTLRKQAVDALEGVKVAASRSAGSGTDAETAPEMVQVRDPRLSSQDNAASDDQPSRPSVQLTETVVYVTKNPQEAAKWLWAEIDEFVPRERVAEWLGQRETLHVETLVVYMDYFYFAGMRLDSAFRKLCSKLYFKAEAQQIDRILEAFANRFWACNTRSVFGSADVVYAIVYSLLLLNTDLHVAQGNHNRMTRPEFVRNTMSAIYDQRQPDDNAQGDKPSKEYTFSKAWEADIESHLKELYTSVKQYQVLQPNSRRSTQSVVQLEKQNSLLGGRHSIGIKRSVHSMIRKTPRESVSDEIQPRKSTSSGPRFTTTAPRSTRRESFSSVASGTSYGSHGRGGIPLSPYQSMGGANQFRNSTNGIQNQSDIASLNQAPYLKEGVVIRKHLLENAQQRARHREWKECFLVVGQGELKMYALQGTGEPDRKSMFRPSSIHFGVTEGNSSQLSLSSMSQHSQRWVSNTQLVGSIQLNHTLSNVLPPPGYNRQRPHVFAIQKPDGGVFLYQASSAEQANEWVATCNYWAARRSKEPLAGGVSNMEYGWGDCLDSVLLDLDTECGMVISPTQPITNEDDLVLYDWHPPAPPSVSSTLSERDQHESLKKHLATLNIEINNHHDTKTKLMIKFPPKSPLHTKALSNWESRSKYLLHDIIKYQNYCDMLEKSLQRQDAEEATTAASSSRLVFKTSTVDLMKEIGEELQLAF